MANKRLPLKEQLQVLYNTPGDLRGLNDLCIKMTGKTLGYGGIVYIQDSGEKKKDSIYLDKFKPGLYYCKANSTTTSNDTSIFIDYSNYTIGNKLENMGDLLQYTIEFNSGNIIFNNNTLGARVTSDSRGILLPSNMRILVIANGSTGPNSYGLGIFPNAEKAFNSMDCGFSFQSTHSARIRCTHVLKNTNTIYVRSLTMNSPYNHPNKILAYRDIPENNIDVICIFLNKK